MLKLNRRISVDALFSAFDSTKNQTFVSYGERHNFWELVYIADGVVGIAEDEKIYTLKKGDIIFHMPMEFHRIWACDDTFPRFLIISFSAIGTDLEVLGEGVFSLDEKGEKTLTEIIADAVSLKDFDDSIKTQMIAINLESLLLNLINTQTPSTIQKKSKGSMNYKKIIEIMNENIGENLSSLDIAKLCGLSLSNLKKTFKAYSGIGVMDYFNNLKMLKAMSLIDEGLNFSEISNMLGYSTPNYFSEVFKKRCGYTPSQFKNRYGPDKGPFYEHRFEL